MEAEEGMLERTIEDCGGEAGAGKERVASCLYSWGACQEQGRPWGPRVGETETAGGMRRPARSYRSMVGGRDVRFVPSPSLFSQSAGQSVVGKMALLLVGFETSGPL
jgi:hypothetical protein